jgi:hypothetical protein
MKSIRRTAAALLVAFALAAPSYAGQVRLEIRDGLVTLSAKDASVREVLAEWARVGRTKIVNAELVPSGALSIELVNVPEVKALDILLRSVAGYVAAPRPVALTAASRYDRIMVMPLPRPAPGVAAPTPTPASRINNGRPQFPRRMYQPQPSLMLDDQDEPVDNPQPAPEPPSQSGNVGTSQPGMPTQMPGSQPGANPTSPGTARPGMTVPPAKPGGGPGGGQEG